MTKKQNEKQFNITGVCRSDLQSIGFETDTLKDKDMEEIAQRLAEGYMEGGANFWENLESIAIELYHLKQHEM